MQANQPYFCSGSLASKAFATQTFLKRLRTKAAGSYALQMYRNMTPMNCLGAIMMGLHWVDAGQYNAWDDK